MAGLAGGAGARAAELLGCWCCWASAALLVLFGPPPTHPHSRNPSHPHSQPPQPEAYVSKLVIVPGIVTAASRPKHKATYLTLQCKECKCV